MDDKFSMWIGGMTIITGAVVLVVASLPDSPKWSHDAAKITMLLFGLITMASWWDFCRSPGYLGKIAIVVELLMVVMYISIWANLQFHFAFSRAYWTFFNIFSLAAPLSAFVVHRWGKPDAGASR